MGNCFPVAQSGRFANVQSKWGQFAGVGDFIDGLDSGREGVERQPQGD